jgi:hypothetical protein
LSFTPEQMLRFRAEAKRTGESEARVAQRLTGELPQPPRQTETPAVQRAQREHLRERTVTQLNASLAHAADLNDAVARQAAAAAEGNDNELAATTKLVTELVRRTPIIVSRDVDRLDLGTKFAATFELPLSDQPFPNGLTPSLSGAAFDRLVGVPHRTSLLKEPRALLLRYGTRKDAATNEFWAESKPLVDIIGRAVTSGVTTLRELDQRALGRLKTQDRIAIERAAEPKK